MSRHERRALASEMRKQRAAWPERLTAIPESEWPARAGRTEWPFGVWRSRECLVQLYDESRPDGTPLVRMTVNRVTIQHDGHWHADISWDDLQRCKREVGLGGWYGVEVYPRDEDVVHDANMRHVWLMPDPLPIGWVT